ncbi:MULTISPECIES: DUF4350 domain-containing protein [Alcanivorax]|jgi:hypothetical protein|uniref:DUF4350 domain-containing protein n=1 Tax=Alcanivorax TaxID=59753 RepID=UPI002355D045|nr:MULTISPECIES: DUF4350 domain-containing protein [Alcanivorax]|tara:strand:+ start:4330 stop:5637 length:1308 start_codon:yes stop_codon:yes gene_type:complete
MRRKLPWLGALLVVALIIAYYALTEPVTVIQRTAPDSAIQRNPYSAAQAWLAQRGQPSQRVLSAAALFPLPEEDTTLIIDKQRGLLSHSQVRALLHWVEAGGELIVEARMLPRSLDEDTATDADWQDNDDLLYSLGITVWEGEETVDEEELDPFFELLDALPAFAGNPLQYCLLTDNEELRATCEALACEAPPQPEPLLLHAGDDQPSRRIQLHSQHVLWHDSWNEDDSPQAFLPEWPVEVTAYADNEYGSQLVQLSLGDGQVTVLTDLGLWDNQNLLYFDHAWLLAWLTGNQPVWFVRSVAMPPLMQWLWLRAPELGTALLLLVALWLWSRIPRRGPIQPVAEDHNRDYLQHLHASGYFQWRTEQQDTLLTALRQQALARLNRYHHQRQQALERAASHLKVTVAQLDHALTQPPANRDQLAQQVALLQALRSDT